MGLFHTRKPKEIFIRVWSKEQKECLLEIMEGFAEKAHYISHTKNYIDYSIVFNYSINLTSFLTDIFSSIGCWFFNFIK